jgi:hypothetical protein
MKIAKLRVLVSRARIHSVFAFLMQIKNLFKNACNLHLQQDCKTLSKERALAFLTCERRSL